MTKELLLGELNKNNEFNDNFDPLTLSKLIGRNTYIIDKIFIYNDNICDASYTGEALGCAYAAIGKSYTIDLSKVSHSSEFDQLNIQIEFSIPEEGLEIAVDQYDRVNNFITFTLHEPEAPVEVAIPSYVNIAIWFYEGK